MDIHEYLSDSDIAIVKHTYTPTGGAEQELLRYLIPRVKSVLYMSHPFPDARGVPLNTAVTFYENGKKVKEILAPLVRGPAPVSHVKDMLFTLWYLKRAPARFRLYIGVDNLNATSGIFLRRLGVVERVIFYVIDYAPQRFRSRLGQALYRMLDRHCCYGSDAVWNVSAAMEEARMHDGIKPERCAPQIEVPLGSRYSEAPKLPIEKIDPYLIVFLGSLRPEQGLHCMIEAMPELKRVVPRARLRVIGDGPEAAALKRLAAEKGVADSIEFLGFVEDDSTAAELVAEGAVGIAPYVKTDETYKLYADPGKVKIYLAAGLPVVVSRVPRVAGLIENNGAGLAIEPDKESLLAALRRFFTASDEEFRRWRQKALELGKQYDWDTIFDRAFEQTLAHWERSAL
ncbi:MAG: glycosyltransferase [Candidatus Abyssobacteria bacterium SURF_17]|uniref:Glycosyltransferase n=1 Tax=Candidatus Abyssobacteria bacterium SURF_17 TaxID=2093361 RepID=A0A419EQJ7_9BACT|nr:MAG: glycosyltransferase [Candidatus Abyssubacteria bacterium SURF_17]